MIDAFYFAPLYETCFKLALFLQNLLSKPLCCAPESHCCTVVVGEDARRGVDSVVGPTRPSWRWWFEARCWGGSLIPYMVVNLTSCLNFNHICFSNGSRRFPKKLQVSHLLPPNLYSTHQGFLLLCIMVGVLLIHSSQKCEKNAIAFWFQNFN